MLEARKQKKCKSCWKPFTPTRPMQSVCSPACAAVVVLKAKAKREAKAKSEDRKATQEAKEKIKTRGEHLKEAQTAFNSYVRARDAFEPCISCDRPSGWDGQWHASHYRSVGSNPSLRFNLLNVHKACSVCNNWLSGNLTPYRVKLIAKIGASMVDSLESEHPPKKYTIEYLQRLKRIFREKKKRIRRLQDWWMRTEGDVSKKEAMPDALFPFHEKWFLSSFTEAAEDDSASGF